MTNDKEIELIPPGYYTVKFVNEREVMIVDGPYKGRTIFVQMPAFQVKIKQQEIRPEEVINYV